MKAFVMKGIGQVGFMDKPVPTPGPNDAVVRTTHALICTSDSNTVGGGIGPRQDLTLGHETVGVVADVGSEVREFQPGDRVLVGAITPDWNHPAAQAGYASQWGAPLGGWRFSNTKDGVFAEYFHVNDADANMAKIPDDVPDDVAVYCADMLSRFHGRRERQHSDRRHRRRPGAGPGRADVRGRCPAAGRRTRHPHRVGAPADACACSGCCGSWNPSGSTRRR